MERKEAIKAGQEIEHRVWVALGAYCEKRDVPIEVVMKVLAVMVAKVVERQGGQQDDALDLVQRAWRAVQQAGAWRAAPGDTLRREPRPRRVAPLSVDPPHLPRVVRTARAKDT